MNSRHEDVADVGVESTASAYGVNLLLSCTILYRCRTVKYTMWKGNGIKTVN